MKKTSATATLAARKAKTTELLAQDRQKLLTKLPFTGSLVMRLDLVPVSDERLPTAATDGDRIFVDIDFYAQLTAEERLFVLAHEVWHCALLHFLRRGDRWLPPARRHVWKGLYLQSQRSERLRAVVAIDTNGFSRKTASAMPTGGCR